VRDKAIRLSSFVYLAHKSGRRSSPSATEFTPADGLASHVNTSLLIAPKCRRDRLNKTTQISHTLILGAGFSDLESCVWLGLLKRYVTTPFPQQWRLAVRRRNAAAIAAIYGKPTRSRKREEAQRAKRLLTLLPLVAVAIFIANIASILWN
jgi:hypothetical protein